MKTAICYYSRHHENTLKVLQAMAEVGHFDLIDVTSRMAVHLEQYDRVGFASGIYYGKFHPTVIDFARQYLPREKEVFFVYTYGLRRPGYTTAITRAVAERGARLLGEFGCKGFDTYGPFQLVRGIAKGHPDCDDLEHAREFALRLEQTE